MTTNTPPAESGGSLNIDTTGWQTFHCDKCGSVSQYTPGMEVTECFGCTCRRLEAMKINCPCGWTGNYFEQKPGDDLIGRFCPDCGEKGYCE